ncbi:uncharacterized protein LOC119690174 [Teleopsis dalmanni]|uniref:uncharacterized protein LOC119690174 n=1 Tax=Teleopsis dalmanni TaxID=139649 RepID=UPI0018CDEED0|nr:uncharacterized protein LOC119690174 [Teleopsis dalmanni]
MYPRKRQRRRLSRILPNIGGPGHDKRLLLSRVVSSIMLYASPIWAKSLSIAENRKKITKTYRISALRTISAFCTVSDEAAFVIAGVVPIDILADEMRRIFSKRQEICEQHNSIQVKGNEKKISVAVWQNR